MSSLVRPTVSRALHLRILPRPSNLGESREILRLLSQFGEIEYFRNLKYEALSAPNTALVIFKEEKAAEACARKSPLRFRMGKEPPDKPNVPSPPTSPNNADTAPSTSISGSQTESYATPTSSRPNSTPFEAPPLPILQPRIYQIHSNTARAHFRDQINMGPYHGSFKVGDQGSPQKELAKVVPVPGLSYVDWRLKDRPWRIVRKEKEQEHIPYRRKTLQEIYEEGATA